MISSLRNKLGLRLAGLILPLLTLLPINLTARDFTYTYEGQTITYTVLDEEAKTVETRAGAYKIAGNYISGELILPAHPKDGDVEYTLTIVGYDAFYDCKSLTSVTLPETVTGIGDYAFYGCEALTSLTIPASVHTIGYRAFDYAGLKFLRYMGRVTIAVEVSYNCRVVCEPADYDYYASIYNTPSWSKVVTTNAKYLLYYKSYIAGVKLILEPNPYYDGSANNDVTVTFDGKAVDLKSEGERLIKGLKISSPYGAMLSWRDNAGKEWNFELRCHTGGTEFRCTASATPTTVTLESIGLEPVDETFNPTEIYIKFYGKEYAYKGKPITFDGLIPNRTYYYDVYAKYNENDIFEGSSGRKTEKWPVKMNNIVGPTSAEVLADYELEGLKPDRVWWTYGEETLSTSARLDMVTLTPESDYEVTFNIECTDIHNNNSKPIYKFPYKFTTLALELETLQPKCVSPTCAIVAAKTNIADIEPMVGFEWKKYDAPASLMPSSGYGAVCDGMLEGYIKNLQPTSFYNVRAFYESAAGTKYYGEWVTFDPSDFSFFEPTVRTYAVQSVTETSASVRGYALAGTDAIKSQGFEYWRTNGCATQSLTAVPSQSDITTVLAMGQVMTATFENLAPGTEYTYRAFVETDNGYKYGEEQTFVTTAVDGVFTVEADAPEVTVTGYYDLTGRRHDTPVHGLNIVLYSDGTTKKVFVR